LKDNTFAMFYLYCRRFIIYHIFSKVLYFKRIPRALKFILGIISGFITILVLVLGLLMTLLIFIVIGIPMLIEMFLEDKGLKTPGFFTKFTKRVVDSIMPCNDEKTINKT